MTNEKEVEAIALGKWCTAVLANFSKLGEDPVIPQMQSVLAKAIEKKSVTQLRAIKKDLSEWVRGLTAAERATVLAGVENAADQPGAEEDEEAVVRRAIERGRIESEDEYQTLSTWVEFTQDDEERADDLRLVDALLTKFGTNV